ncbi:MAG: riboflavin synthase [Armatimonadota bacterium]
MFTGIIEELGTIKALRREGNAARLALQAEVVRDDLRIGDSLAVNGVCLTVERIEPGELWASMMPETLERSTLGALSHGENVNLERALRLDGRLGGHLVLGHVDGIGQVLKIEGAGEERVLTISLPAEMTRFVAPKGSIAVDGVSLTVVDAESDRFSVSLIRHTISLTTFSLRKPGDRVNLEVDPIARYVARLLEYKEAPHGLTIDRLRELGY